MAAIAAAISAGVKRNESINNGSVMAAWRHGNKREIMAINKAAWRHGGMAK
jgi:hypothetical protein